MAEADEATDWFGYPLPGSGGSAPEAVLCPRCGTDFEDASAFERHAAAEHGIRLRRSGARLVPLRRWWDSLGYLPLWYVAPLDLLLVVIVVAALWRVDPWLALYTGGLVTMPLVLVLSHRIFRRVG